MLICIGADREPMRILGKQIRLIKCENQNNTLMMGWDNDDKRKSFRTKQVPLTGKELGMVRAMVSRRMNALLVSIEVPMVTVKIPS